MPVASALPCTPCSYLRDHAENENQVEAMKTTLFFCCIVLLGTLGFGHRTGATISKGEAQSRASKPTVLENLENGKAVLEKPLTDELEAKGAKKMANNLKEGKPVRWESIIEALTESDVSVYQVDDNFADNQMDADVKEVNGFKAAIRADWFAFRFLCICWSKFHSWYGIRESRTGGFLRCWVSSGRPTSFLTNHET